MSNKLISDSPRKTKYFWSRILLCLLAVYLGIAIGFATLSPQQYTYRHQNFLYEGVTIILQPLMEVVANGKTGHGFHWEKFDSSNLKADIEPATATSRKSQFRDLRGNTFKNIVGDMFWVREAAIVEPVSYTGTWSLVYCQNQPSTPNEFCQKSTLSYSGQIKILVDGSTNLWGLNDQGELIEVRLKQYIDRTQRTDLLFI